jgi:hypothetical protein
MKSDLFSDFLPCSRELVHTEFWYWLESSARIREIGKCEMKSKSDFK